LNETTALFNVPRGAAYITYQQIVVYVTSFVYYILLFRILNLSQIGVVSLLAAAMSVFTTITQVSLPAAATRFISANIGSQDPANTGGVARTTLRLILSFAGPSLLFAILASPIIGPAAFKTSDSTILLIVTFVASFVLDLITLYGAYFLGLGLYAEMVYQNILYVPLSRGLGLVLAYRGLGPLGIPLGWVIGASLTLLLSLYLWKGKLPGSNGFPARPLLIFSLPLFASALITLVQGWGDVALLQALLGQLGTTGAYYIVVSSVAFLSILWSPAAGALYPALSSSYASDGPKSVSDKLGVATRLVNLTVIPAGVGLAVVAPTALEAVYGSSLGNQAVPFAILAVTIIFSAQSLLLITTLQAVGRTTHILGISLGATIIDLVTVGVGASALGTTAGAIGRALLAVSMLALAWLSLRGILHAPVMKGLSKALILAFFSGAPLILVDNSLTLSLHLAPVVRLPALVAVFTISFLTASRALQVFADDDFDLLENALPLFLTPLLRILERILVQIPHSM
jgi:O-antigen/teichoic acid export membrane protein